MRILTTSDPVMEADGDLKTLGDLGSEYTLPKASANTLGGVKVGDNLSIEEDGTLNASGYTLPAATAETLGGIKVGDNLTIGEDGTLDAESYTLPAATAETLGGIKVGDNLTIGEDGTLNASGGGGGFTAFEWTVLPAVSETVQIVQNNSIRIGDVLLVAITLYLTSNLSSYDDVIMNESITSANISNRNVCIRATAAPASNAASSPKNMFARLKGTSPYCLVIAAGESVSASSYPYLTICGVLSLKDGYIS